MKRRRSTGLAYFIAQSIRGLWRNLTTTLVAFLVMICCMVLLGSFWTLRETLELNLDSLSEMSTIRIFLEYEASDEDAARIEKEIKSLDNLGITSVTYISKEQALEDMKNESPDHAHLYDIPDGDNPLADSFVIDYNDTSKATTLDYKLRQIEGVRKVNNRLDIASKITRVKNGVNLVFLFFFAALFVVGVFVIINTVNLTVYYRRDEIFIMRYIGASQFFIAFPFILEGVIIGSASAGASYGLMHYIVGYVEKLLQASELDMISFLPFSELSSTFLIGFFAIGIVSGVIGSLVSVGRPLEA